MWSTLRADVAVVAPDDVSPEPWANGRGTTRVLVSGVDWRISVAEIVGRAPFSPLPGVDRVQVPLSAAGVVLDVDGVERRVPQHSALAFTGESRVVAAMDGRPVQVVNLMTHRAAVRATCEIRRIVGRPPGAADAVIVLGGPVRCGPRALAPGTVIRPGLAADGAGDIVAADGAFVAVIRLVSTVVPVVDAGS